MRSAEVGNPLEDERHTIMGMRKELEKLEEELSADLKAIADKYGLRFTSEGIQATGPRVGSLGEFCYRYIMSIAGINIKDGSDVWLDVHVTPPVTGVGNGERDRWEQGYFLTLMGAVSQKSKNNN